MNTQKKIGQSLRDAPKPVASEDLLDKLQKDINLGSVKTQRPALRRWFAPAGGQVSLWRVAAAAAIAIMVLLPLTYGATRIVKFVVEEFTVMYGVDDASAEYITAFSFSPTIRGDCINNEEDAKQAEKEILQLIKEGKADKINSQEYRAVLSDGGEVIYDTLGLPIEILLSENREEEIKKLTDEMVKMEKSGEFERTFLDVVKSSKGHDVYIYKTRYTLSNGVTISLNSGYEHRVEEIKRE